MMNHFTIFAHGTNFDPDEYLKQAPFAFDRVWHRGDPLSHSKSNRHTTSGIEKTLGNGQELSIDDQDRIATDFLERYHSALLPLSQFPGVATFILGLHYRVERTSGLRGFCMSFSPRLMHFALKTRIDLTFYVDLFGPED